MYACRKTDNIFPAKILVGVTRRHCPASTLNMYSGRFKEKCEQQKLYKIIKDSEGGKVND